MGALQSAIAERVRLTSGPNFVIPHTVSWRDNSRDAPFVPAKLHLIFGCRRIHVAAPPHDDDANQIG